MRGSNDSTCEKPLDLARIEPELLEVTYEKMQPMVAAFKASGLYGPDVQPPLGADLQTRLLAMVGRVA